MEKSDILLNLIDYYTQGNKRRFAEMIGMTPQGISTWLDRNKFNYDILFAKCENVNPHYLLTGEGSITLSEDDNTPYMLKEPVPQSNNSQINELLAIAHTLHEQSVNNAELLKKTQEQFDRVLNMFERVVSLMESKKNEL